MRTLTVELQERSYPIYIGQHLLDEAELFHRHVDSRQVLIVTNDRVAPLYLDRVKAHFEGRDVAVVVLPDGEKYKTLESADAVYEELLARRFSRTAHLIALGGGVIGDLGGFVAATYQRGIPFVQVPTTLLSQVDSSVGGKTAVNHPRGKNMIGAFYQPKCVIADMSTLDTLEDRELSAGLAEVIKYGLIRDQPFLEWLESHIETLVGRDGEALAEAVERSCRNKAEVVARDERETGERATLNLGHTFGHAVETGMGYGAILHGEAVAIGTCQAADLSERLGFLQTVDVARVISILERALLPVRPPASLGADDFLTHMAVDKKNVEGQLRVILLKALGEATLPMSVDVSALRQTLEHYGRD
ncbi:MAG: 3-dehydroquinate synthase [Pseudomonadota bacterium]